MNNKQAINFIVSNDPSFIKAVKRVKRQRDKLKQITPLEAKVRALKEFDEREFGYESK